MPFGDGTGPGGMGAMTGRGLGYCAGYPHPGFAAGRGGWGGRGFGRGFGGGGRGWRNRYWATGVPGWAVAQGAAQAPIVPQPVGVDNEAEILKQQAEALSQSLEQINKRLEALEKEKE